MSLFETTVYAAPAGGAGGDAGLINLLFLGGFVLIFYFLLILFSVYVFDFAHDNAAIIQRHR